MQEKSIIIITLSPNWPAPTHIRAYTTTRQAGNLADHVGDNPEDVQTNRDLLIKTLALPSEPVWLEQVHGIKTLCLDNHPQKQFTADASYTTKPGIVCAVLTADCLPILVCDRAGTMVAAIHAGWRGLAIGIIEHAIAQLPCPPDQLVAWVGPGIGPTAFEVGPEVRTEFLEKDHHLSSAFTPGTKPETYLGNLYQIAKQCLNNAGVRSIYSKQCCTFSDTKRFFSYRRDGKTGRMASLIWMD